MLSLEGMMDGVLKFWGVCVCARARAPPISKNQTPLLFFKGLEVGDCILKIS